MSDVDEVLERFGIKTDTRLVSIIVPEEHVKAEEQRILEDIRDLRWLVHDLKEEFERISSEAKRWKSYYESYSKYFRELSELRNYLDSILFEVRSARKEKVVTSNALIREVGEKRIAFSNLVTMLSRVESTPLGSKIKALEELKKVFKKELTEEVEKEEKKEEEKVETKPPESEKKSGESS